MQKQNTLGLRSAKDVHFGAYIFDLTSTHMHVNHFNTCDIDCHMGLKVRFFACLNNTMHAHSTSHIVMVCWPLKL